MADNVRRILEHMLPEFEVYEEQGILTSKEVKRLVKQRSDFEYALQRKAVNIEDFQRYIKYETQLKKLVDKRCRRLNVKRQAQHTSSVKQRITFLYERALMKFPGNLRLWKLAIEQAKEERSVKVLSKLFAKALQLHPRVAEFWIAAGAFEFEENGDVVAARSMFQRGLRLCHSETILWCEYLKFELLFLLKLRDRRKALGLQDQIKKDTKINIADNGEKIETSSKELSNAKENVIPFIVYKKAIENLPANGEFIKQLSDVICEFLKTDLRDVSMKLLSKVWSNALSNEKLKKSSSLWYDLILCEFEHAPFLKAESEVLEEYEILTKSEIHAMRTFEMAKKVCSDLPLLQEYIVDFLYSSATKRKDENQGASSADILNLIPLSLIEDVSLTDRTSEILQKLSLTDEEVKDMLKKSPLHFPLVERKYSNVVELTKEDDEFFSMIFETMKKEGSHHKCLRFWLLYFEKTIEAQNKTLTDVVQVVFSAVRWIYTECNEEYANTSIGRLLEDLFEYCIVSQDRQSLLEAVFTQLETASVVPVIPEEVYIAFGVKAKGIVEGSFFRKVMNAGARQHPTSRKLWLQLLQFERESKDILKEQKVLTAALSCGGLQVEDCSLQQSD